MRKCVHCGFCTATCPTYVLLGDELDSPRGRIYLIKDMLENDRPATAEVVQHIDRCLSASSCMTTCPSGVHYQHLIDHARVHVELTFRRPWPERSLRALLAGVLPFPRRFAQRSRWPRSRGRSRGCCRRVARDARARAAPAPRRCPRRRRGAECDGPARAMRLAFSPAACRPSRTRDQRRDASGCSSARRRGRRDSTAAAARSCITWARAPVPRSRRLIERLRARAQAPGSTPSWRTRPAAALTSRTSATCFATMRNLLRAPQRLRQSARRHRGARRARAAAVVSSVARLAVAYHSACSMQHGQKVEAAPRALLASAGFAVREIPEGHLCCGSAGTYNILQPELATRLRDRKVANIAHAAADVVATGNIGCITQLCRRRCSRRAHRGVPGLGHRRPAAAGAREASRFAGLNGGN